MTSADGNNTVVARHLEALANAAKDYTLARLANISSGSGGSTIGILDTVPSTVDGGLWYEMIDNAPRLKLRKGNYEYIFMYDRLKYVGSGGDLVAYLPFDTSTTADECGNEWTAQGNATLDTQIKKFGAASVHLPSGAYLNATNDNFNFSCDRWTFDCCAYPINFDHCIFGLGTLNINMGGIFLYQKSMGFVTDDGGSFATYSLGDMSTNTWYHIAVVKDYTIFYVFLNGILKVTHTGTPLMTNTIELGGARGYFTDNVYLDNVRLFVGEAFWTSDFTPPTAEDYA